LFRRLQLSGILNVYLMKNFWNFFPYILISIITVTLVLLVIKANSWLEISPVFLLVFRLFSVAMLILYAVRKKSLTTWILVSMVAGAEFGYDFPAIG